jgi:exonuclease III
MTNYSNIRIVTWNILIPKKYRKGSFPLAKITFSLDRKMEQTLYIINRLIKEYDVICLQEVAEVAYNTLKPVFEANGFNIYAPKYTRGQTHTSIIATKLPVLRWEMFKVANYVDLNCTDMEHNHNSCIDISKTSRMAVLVHLKCGKTIATTHVVCWYSKKYAMRRYIEGYMNECRRRSNDTVIITGDFNTGHDEENMKSIMNSFQDMNLCPTNGPTNMPARHGEYKAHISHIISNNMLSACVIEPKVKIRHTMYPNIFNPSDHIPYGVKIDYLRKNNQEPTESTQPTHTPFTIKNTSTCKGLLVNKMIMSSMVETCTI